MSELVCIAFKDSSTADRVLNELRAMEKDYVLDLEDAVIVVRDMDGKVHLQTVCRCVWRCDDTRGGTGHVVGWTHGPAVPQSPGGPFRQSRWGSWCRSVHYDGKRVRTLERLWDSR
jgi:Predicted membrane protein